MPSLIWVFAEGTGNFVGFVMLRLIIIQATKNLKIYIMAKYRE